MHARNLLIISAVWLVASSVWAASGATRTLVASPAVPAGASLRVENLAGHMRVVQGPAFKVTASVMAGGADAQALAQSIKLEVNSAGNQVTVHVHYPVERYDSYRLRSDYPGDQVCMLGIFCFHGNGHSAFDYQGARVRVYQNGGSGTPLYVNLTVEVPAGMRATLLDGAGLLQATALNNTLTLQTKSGDIAAQKIRGDLTTDSEGGDTRLDDIVSQNLVVNTEGGDLNASELRGSAQLQTGGGDITLKNASGRLQTASGGGDTQLSGNLSELDTLSIRTGGGDLRLTGDLAALRQLDIRSGGGDAVLRVTGLDMQLDAQAGGGDVSVQLPGARNVHSSDGSFSGDLGNAAGRGSIASGGGDITVTQS